MDDLGITKTLKWEFVGSWIARAALALIVWFLFRLVNQLDNAQLQIERTNNALMEIQSDVKLLKYQVGQTAKEIDKIREEQKFQDKIIR